MLRDLKSKVNAAITLGPAARTSTANGTSVDTQGYGAAMYLVMFGTYTDGTHTPLAEHSDDGSAWSSVAASDLDGAFTAVNSGAGAQTIQRIGYLGAKRYLRATITITGATTGATTCAIIARSSGVQQPV